SMLTSNPGIILKAMPAESVSSIELITEPGAKYDAEGSGMIINLVTNRQRINDGYNGNANLSVSNKSLMVGINGTAKINKVNLNAGIDYNYAFPGANKARISDETEYFNNIENKFAKSSSINDQKFSYIGGNFSLTWEKDENNLFTMDGDYYSVKGYNKIEDNVTQMLDKTGTINSAYSKNSIMDMTFDGGSFSAAYQHDFNRKNNYLGVNYQFNFNKMSMPAQYSYSNLMNYTPAFILEETDLSNYSREHTVQIDYTNVLSSHAKIETGVKGIFRRNSAMGESKGSNNSEDFINIESDASDMRQPQDIFSVYGIYTATYGKFSGIAGVRYENTRMGIRFPSAQEKNFTTHLNDIVPNTSLTYNFSPSQSLSASYSMKISRPSIQQLNPFRLNISDMRIQEGNPYLKSERINRINVTYNNFGRNLGGSISMDYNRTDNAISTVAYTEGFNIINTYANIGRRQTGTLNVFLNWSPKQSLRFSINTSCTYTGIRTGNNGIYNDMSNHGLSGTVNANINWDIPMIFTFSAYGGWNSSQIQLMSKSGEFHYYGMSFTRSLLKDDSLKVTLSASNFFEKYNTFVNITDGDDFRTTNRWKNPSWNVGMTLTWNFGKSLQGARSVNSIIINDDLSTTQSSGGFNSIR
ncbi:MAG: outer membrane beta-barrel family protein, partial [Muribaculaceae bacterium]|nr:outer membrane beta-barrel family protein [Muribaculaceae bacterium]